MPRLLAWLAVVPAAVAVRVRVDSTCPRAAPLHSGVCEQAAAGVYMAIHPDDPPMPLLGYKKVE